MSKKIDPTIFAVWVRILQLVPDSVLWLLRFPSAGEEQLKRTATIWANSEIASRLLFTDVVPKEEHLRRIRIADLVLDTVEVREMIMGEGPCFLNFRQV